MASKPLDGITVLALEQAVAAPYCSSRLADAGARVIKIERAEGDFARGYDHAVHGESSYFVWINRGKESIALDLRSDADRSQFSALVAAADVFIQNLAPGATTRLGFGSAKLRKLHPRLITCDISGYGESGPLHELKAYDLLVQAESGLVAVSGAPGPWGRIGVSICDITAGMNALIGIQQALLQRERTGRGSGVKVSLFDSAAELMAVPYLQARYGAGAPDRVGLKHPSIAPYGAFTCSDGREFVLSIQNEREWASFCQRVLLRPDVATDVRFASNNVRTSNRVDLESLIRDVFAGLTYAQAVDRLTEAQTAYGAINSVHDLIQHPQLRTRPMNVRGLVAEIPATPYTTEWDDVSYPEAPAIDQHGDALRREFELRSHLMHFKAVDTLEAFRARALAEGFDEVLERVWAPGLEIETHSHPFDAEAIVVQGEMWLSCAGQTRHLAPGDTFVLACGTPHAERYGPAGATYWVARRTPVSPP